MKALRFKQYGAPEVLQIVDIPKPKPASHEVVVRIQATAVNSGDIRLRRADPFAVRFMLGLFKPNITVLGSVFSGSIEAVGSAVTQYTVGEEVFGSTTLQFGAYAEFICLPETAPFSLKPSQVSHAEAASIPFGATTALYFLRKANVQANQRWLVYGASGAVGSAAVQLLHSFGAHVTAVCSKENVALVSSLGADIVLDYKHPNFKKSLASYDVIYDTVNKLSVKTALHGLQPKGIFIAGAAGLKEMLTAVVSLIGSKKKVLFGMIKQQKEDIRLLSDLIMQKQIRPVIDKYYSMNDIVDAHHYVEQGHKKGNVVITL